MDYLDIVLRGYYNLTNREHLSEYFFREFKKAEKEHYGTNEFFDGCLKVIEAFEHDLDNKISERKGELSLGLNLSKQGLRGIKKGVSESELKKRYDFAESKGLTYKQLCQKTIRECKTELKEISRYDFFVNLSSYTKGKITNYMEYNEVLYIKTAILEAYKNNLPQQKENNITKKEYDSLVIARAFCLWELFNAGKLENYYQIRPDGYYRFKRKIFEDFIRSKFELKPKESSATIYRQAIQFINSNRYDFYTKEAPEYSKNCKYGLKLFNTMQ